MQNTELPVRNKRGLIVLGVALACTVSATVTSVRAASVALPFHAVIQGTASLSPTADPCTFTNHITGSGTALHLGAANWESLETVRFASCAGGVLAGNITVHGNFTLTAANGDQIQGTYTASGTADQNGVSASGTFAFTGGTGRFINVTGGGNTAVQGTPLTVGGSLDGRINY